MIKKRPPMKEDTTRIHLPELEQIAKNDELTPFGADVIEELVELSCSSPGFEIVAYSTIAQVKITDHEDISRHSTLPYAAYCSL
jgi:hypothetical protein